MGTQSYLSWLAVLAMPRLVQANAFMSSVSICSIIAIDLVPFAYFGLSLTLMTGIGLSCTVTVMCIVAGMHNKFWGLSDRFIGGGLAQKTPEQEVIQA